MRLLLLLLVARSCVNCKLFRPHLSAKYFCECSAFFHQQRSCCCTLRAAAAKQQWYRKRACIVALHNFATNLHLIGHRIAGALLQAIVVVVCNFFNSQFPASFLRFHPLNAFWMNKCHIFHMLYPSRPCISAILFWFFGFYVEPNVAALVLAFN